MGAREESRGTFSIGWYREKETLRIYQEPKRTAMSYRSYNVQSYAGIIFMSTFGNGPSRYKSEESFDE